MARTTWRNPDKETMNQQRQRATTTIYEHGQGNRGEVRTINGRVDNETQVTGIAQ